MTDSIQAAYIEAERRYVAANPASRAAHETATTSLPGGNTRSVLHWEPYPLCIGSAEGYTVRDADGHAYVDLLGEYSAGLYGHSHPVIMNAIAETLRRGLGYGGPHVAEARLAARIRERFRSMRSVRFANSGTEANLMALAAAKAFTGRYRGRVLVFEGGYHGGVLVFPVGCRYVWGGDGDGGSGNSKYDVLRALNAPHDFLVARYNDVASVDAVLASVSPSDGDGVAAILIEPMLGSGGGVCATREFLAHLRRRADELGAPLIFDEVMTSRPYDGGGIQSELGVRPDLTTLGKYIGGGMSCGAFGGREDVMALFDPRAKTSGSGDGGGSGGGGGGVFLPHAGTFNNNVLTMNVGAVGLEEVFTSAKARELHVLGDEVRRRINAFAVDDSNGGNGSGGSSSGGSSSGGDGDSKGKGRALRVLGCGSILVFHFTRTAIQDIKSPDDWKDEDARLLDLFHLEMLHEGFYLARRRYVALSIAFLKGDGRGELDRFVRAVGRFVGKFRDLIA
ncbi:class III aminotransferase [Xylaria sp. FL0043]|nr:class III aminotransferase [Xylaria sp. FL0043]